MVSLFKHIPDNFKGVSISSKFNGMTFLVLLVSLYYKIVTYKGIFSYHVSQFEIHPKVNVLAYIFSFTSWSQEVNNFFKKNQHAIFFSTILPICKFSDHCKSLSK